MKSVFSLFKDYAQARSAVTSLMEHGFREKEINAVVDAATGEQSLKDVRHAKPSREPDAKSEALGGRSLFGLDAIIAGQQPVHIPDAGMLRVGGEMATIVLKEAKGTDSSLARTLADLHIGSEAARAYLEGIRKGDVLVWVRTEDNRAGVAASTMRRWHAAQVTVAPG